MMKNSFIIKLVVIITTVSSLAVGTNIDWIGGTDSNWGSVANWSRTHIPRSTEVFRIGDTGDPGIYLNVDAVGIDESRLGWDLEGDPSVSRVYSDAHNMHIYGDLRIASDAANTSYLTLTGTGSVTTDGNLRVGHSGAGYFNISDSAVVTAGKNFVVSYNDSSSGVVNQTGGTITIAWALQVDGLGAGYDNYARYNLDGGTVSATGLAIGAAGNLDITLGTLTLIGDWVNLVQTMYSDGRITAYGGDPSATININYTGGNTVVTAVPFSKEDFSGKFNYIIAPESGGDATVIDSDGDGLGDMFSTELLNHVGDYENLATGDFWLMRTAYSFKLPQLEWGEYVAEAAIYVQSADSGGVDPTYPCSIYHLPNVNRSSLTVSDYQTAGSLIEPNFICIPLFTSESFPAEQIVTAQITADYNDDPASSAYSTFRFQEDGLLWKAGANYDGLSEGYSLASNRTVDSNVWLGIRTVKFPTCRYRLSPEPNEMCTLTDTNGDGDGDVISCDKLFVGDDEEGTNQHLQRVGVTFALPPKLKNEKIIKAVLYASTYRSDGSLPLQYDCQLIHLPNLNRGFFESNDYERSGDVVSGEFVPAEDVPDFGCVVKSIDVMTLIQQEYEDDPNTSSVYATFRLQDSRSVPGWDGSSQKDCFLQGADQLYLDIETVIEPAVSSEKADLNEDGIVDITDVGMLASEWLEQNDTCNLCNNRTIEDTYIIYPAVDGTVSDCLGGDVGDSVVDGQNSLVVGDYECCNGDDITNCFRRGVCIFSLPELEAGTTVARAQLLFYRTQSSYDTYLTDLCSLYHLPYVNRSSLVASDYEEPGSVVKVDFATPWGLKEQYYSLDVTNEVVTDYAKDSTASRFSAFRLQADTMMYPQSPYGNASPDQYEFSSMEGTSTPVLIILTSKECCENRKKEDLDGNCKIDLTDFGILAQKWKNQKASTIDVEISGASAAISTLTVSGQSYSLLTTDCGFSLYEPGRGDTYFTSGTVENNGEKSIFTCTEDNIYLRTEFVRKRDYIAVNGTLESLQPISRGFVFNYKIRRPDSPWTYSDGINSQVVVSEDVAEQNIYPLASMSWPDDGIAMAIPPTAPCHFGTRTTDRKLVLTQYFGVSPESYKFPNKAEFSFIIYPIDPAWNFRSAIAKYYSFYPQFYEAPLIRDGLWMINTDSSDDIPLDLDHYGHDECSWDSDIEDVFIRDEEAGILDFPYEIVGTRGIYNINSTPPANYDEAMALLDYFYDESVSHRRRIENCGCFLPDGHYIVQWDTELPYTIRWTMNPNPNLFYGLGKQTVGQEVLERFLSGIQSNPWVDGIYLDSFGQWPRRLNFRQEHFAYIEYPLTIYSDGQVAVSNQVSHYEFVEALRPKAHINDKFVMINGIKLMTHNSDPPEHYTDNTLGRFFPAALADIGSSEPLRHTLDHPYYEFGRTAMGRKIYTTLNFEWSNQSVLEKILNKSLLYATFAANNGGYYPTGYERDKELINWFVPNVRLLHRAGWEPVTYATANYSAQDGLYLERYGNGDVIYFAVMSEYSRTCLITIDTSVLGETGQWDIHEVARHSTVQQIGNNQLQVVLAPWKTKIIRMEK
jgi:T5SS/PEP-CTERM-associated repeat protein